MRSTKPVLLTHSANKLRSRSVPDEVFLKTHTGQRSSLADLFEKYQTNQNVKWKLYSNSKFGKAGTVIDTEDVGKTIKQQATLDVTNEVENAKALTTRYDVANLKPEEINRIGNLLQYYK